MKKKKRKKNKSTDLEEKRLFLSKKKGVRDRGQENL